MFWFSIMAGQATKGMMQSFRECDVRGKYPSETNEGLFLAIGKAIGARWRGNGPIAIRAFARRTYTRSICCRIGAAK
jgi:hypothetical protein